MKHNISGKCSHFQSFTWSGLPWSDGRFSAIDPLLIRQFSERIPQALHKGSFQGFLSKSTPFPRDLRIICVGNISSTIGRDFQQLFRAFSGWKKGEKQAESGICGKRDFGIPDHS